MDNRPSNLAEQLMHSLKVVGSSSLKFFMFAVLMLGGLLVLIVTYPFGDILDKHDESDEYENDDNQCS